MSLTQPLRVSDGTAEMGMLSVTRGPLHLPTDVRDGCGLGLNKDREAEECNWLTQASYPRPDFETASPAAHSTCWEGVGGRTR